MTQNHNEPQAFAQMFKRIPQAAENIVAQAVARNPNDKQVVWTLVKDQFDGHPRVRAPEHDRKRMLRRRAVLLQQAEIPRIDVDHTPCQPGALGQTVEQCREGMITVAETQPGRLRVVWPRTCRRTGGPVSVDDFDGLHPYLPDQDARTLV